MTFCSTRSKIQSNLKYNTLRYYSLLIIELLTAPMWCSKQGTTCVAASISILFSDTTNEKYFLNIYKSSLSSRHKKNNDIDISNNIYWNIEQTSNSSIIVRFHSPLNSVITIKISSLPSYSTLAKEASGAINLLSKAFTSFSPVDSGSSTTLAGNPAERLVFAARAGQVEIKELQVFTIKGGTEYILSYGSTKEVFSKDLPVGQKMIDSFQITR